MDSKNSNSERKIISIKTLISLPKKLNQRSCPPAEPAKSHKKLKKKQTSSAIQMRVNEMQKQKQNPQHKFTQHFKIQHKDSDHFGGNKFK